MSEKSDDDPMTVKEAFEWLEKEGVLRRNGKYRKARNGEYQPVFVITEKGRKWLESRGLVPPLEH